MASLDDQIQAWLRSQGRAGSPLKDYALSDFGDGKGAVIARWNAGTLGPQPTAQQLAAVDTTPVENERKLAESDAWMARIAEDAATAYATGKPLPQAAIDKINQRRRLRGQPPI